MSGNESINIKFGADIASFLKGVDESKEHLERATEGMQGSLGSLIKSFEHFGVAALAIGAAGLAMEGFKEGAEYVAECVEKTNALARAFEGLNFQTGASLEELNVLKVGMNMTGGSIEELEGWMKGATRAMKANADMLVANGIAGSKAALMAMPFTEYLQKVMEKADLIQEPFRRSTFLMEALGRSGMEAAPQIRRLLENMDEAKESMDKFGNAIDEHSIRKMQEMEKEMGRLKTVSESITKDIADNSSTLVQGWAAAKLAFLQLVDALVGGKSTLADVFAGKASTADNGSVWTSRGYRDKDKDGIAKPDAEQGDTDENLMQNTEDGWQKVSALIAAAKIRDEDRVAESKKIRTKEEIKAAEEAAKIQHQNFVDTEKNMADLAKFAAAEARAKIDLALGVYELEHKILEDEDKEATQKAKRMLDRYKLEREEAKENYRAQKSIVDGAMADWDHNIISMINGTQNFGHTFRQIMLSTGQYFEQMVVKMGLDWMKGELLKSAATKAGVAERGLTEEEGAIKSLATSAAVAIKDIAIKGAQAAAGAYAAIASIPIYGPVLAPAAAAVALAAVIGIGSKVASAEGGWDQVPSDQLAMIHKNEMVLPAHLAERVRSMSGGGGGDGATHVHFHGPVFDKKGVERFFDAHQGALLRTLGTAARNGRSS